MRGFLRKVAWNEMLALEPVLEQRLSLNVGVPYAALVYRGQPEIEALTFGAWTHRCHVMSENFQLGQG